MGLLGTLGKIGMGVGQMIPGVGPILGAAAGALRNNRGGAPKPGFGIDTTSQAGSPEARANITGAAEGLSGLSQFGADQAKGFLGDARSSLTGATDYYKSLMTDPASQMQALAPEINQSRQNTAATIDQIQRFGGRGGGAAQAGRDARIAGMGDITGIMSRARPMAAEGLRGVAGMAGQIGGQAGNLAGFTGQAAGNLGLGMMGADLNQQRMINATRMGQAQLGSGERAQNTLQNNQLGSNLAEQGGLGGALKKIPGLFREDGSSRIPGLGRLMGAMGTGQEAQLPSGTMPTGNTPTGSPTVTATPSYTNAFGSPGSRVIPSTDLGSSSFWKPSNVSGQYQGGRRAAANKSFSL
jgi:hypothetical protein